MNELRVVERNRDNNNYNLTSDQNEIAGRAIDFIAADFNPNKFVIGITGAGGVGKTYTINYIIRHCKYSASVIMLGTPTHKACRVLGDATGKSVSTIQSIFGFRLDMRLEDFNPHKPQFNPMAKAKLEGIKVLVIDEASMIPAGVVTYICNKCKALEIKLIFTGDPHQLSPVNEKKSIAFERCFAVFNLTKIVRQSADNPITPLLQILRKDIDNRTYKFIEYITKRIGHAEYNELGEGYAILRQGAFNQSVNNSFSNENYTKNIDMYRIIAYTNHNVSGWNNYIRHAIIKDSDKHIITKNDLIMSYETIVNEFMEPVINNSEEYIINDITNFVDADYGFEGFLVKFQLVHGGLITIPLFVINHRHFPSVLIYDKVVNTLIKEAKMATSANRTSKWKQYYAFKKKYLIAQNIIDSNQQVLHKRDIDYGFSITSHKSQGSTYDSVFVDVNNMVYDKNNRPYANQDDLLRRLYVACSRPKKELILNFGR